MTDDEHALRARVRELEAEVREYKHLLYSPPIDKFRLLKLQPKRARVLAAIYASSPNIAHLQRLWCIFDENVAEAAVRVAVHKINQALCVYSVNIKSEWGVGYFLDSENKARLDALMEKLEQEAA